MNDFGSLEKQLMQSLALQRRPIAVTFLAEAPAGARKFEGTEPSGCSFWRLAAAGDNFYTLPQDHYNCPIGSHTHNIHPPAERAAELPQILDVMVSTGYLRMEEVPGIPVLPTSPNAIAYSPLGESRQLPDVVLVAAKPAKIMLLEEAARRAGTLSQLPLLGRPTCMAIPAAMAHGVTTSAGCIGNRVYTNVGDDELYAAIPGNSLARVCSELQTILQANQTLEQYHRSRREQLASA